MTSEFLSKIPRFYTTWTIISVVAAFFGTQSYTLQKASLALLFGACLGGTWVALVESNNIASRLRVSTLTVHIINFIVHVLPLLLLLVILKNKRYSSNVNVIHIILICALFMAIYAASGNVEVYNKLKYASSAALISFIGTLYLALRE